MINYMCNVLDLLIPSYAVYVIIKLHALYGRCLRNCQPKGSDDHECEHICRSRGSASSVRAAVVDSACTIEALRLNGSGITVFGS